MDERGANISRRKSKALAPSLTRYESEDDELLLPPAGKQCKECGNDIRLTDEVFLFKVVQAYYTQGKLQYADVLNGDGDYKHEPLFFDFSCWEEQEEELATIQEDVPPVHDHSGLLLCDICRSDIREGEALGLLYFGEIQVSERMPNNETTPVFVPMGDAKHICLACIYHLDNNKDEPYWPEDIEPVPGVDVCVEGIFERCWRYGNCACPHSK